MRDVWLNTKDGTFSNSWGELEHKRFNPDVPDKESEWKLIRYECLSDGKFKFIDGMKINGQG